MLSWVLGQIKPALGLEGWCSLAEEPQVPANGAHSAELRSGGIRSKEPGWQLWGRLPREGNVQSGSNQASSGGEGEKGIPGGWDR